MVVLHHHHHHCNLLSTTRRNGRLWMGLVLTLYCIGCLELRKVALLAKCHNDSTTIPSQLSHFVQASTAARNDSNITSTAHPQAIDAHPRCAINLYGLPRAFQSLVLPSLMKNVIAQNPSCDYFLHVYQKDKEGVSRSGKGGLLDSPQSVLQSFQQAVHSINPQAVIGFANDTDASFEHKRHTVIHQVKSAGVRIGNKKNNKNKNKWRPLYYHPDDNATSNQVPNNVWNVLKMWHSQESVWDLMQEHINQQILVGKASDIYYDYVGMLRLDVFYATPVNILEFANSITSMNVVIPGFGRHDVSDRMVYGPYEAIKVWATQRFESMKSAAISLHQEGESDKLMHSETFVERVVLPKMEELGYKILEHESMCFFRARAEETLWVTDCYYNALDSVWVSLAGLEEASDFRNLRSSYLPPVRRLVQDILQRPCDHFYRFQNDGSMGIELLCPRNNTSGISPPKSLTEEEVIPKYMRRSSLQ